jgi:hypothetical protein
MGLLQTLREAFGGRAEPELSGPEAFEAAADAEQDTPDMLGESPSDPQANVDGLVLGIVYEDTRGKVSRRMVRVKAIGPSDGAGYVHGFCQLRRADRTFRIDGIREVVDHRTGETFTDAAAYFLPYVEIARWRDFAEPAAADTGRMSNPTQMVLSSVRDEIKIVLYVARADGDFQVDEQDVISDFIRRRAAMLGEAVARGYDHGRIMAWARNMNPDYATFERAVQRLATRPDVDVADVWHTCKTLVMADREIEPREVDAMDSLFVAIRNAGIRTPLN